MLFFFVRLKLTQGWWMHATDKCYGKKLTPSQRWVRGRVASKELFWNVHERFVTQQDQLHIGPGTNRQVKLVADKANLRPSKKVIVMLLNIASCARSGWGPWDFFMTPWLSTSCTAGHALHAVIARNLRAMPVGEAITRWCLSKINSVEESSFESKGYTHMIDLKTTLSSCQF